MSPITTADGLGAAMTPEEWATFVLDHLAHASVLLASGATRIDTESKSINVPRLTGDGSTAWLGELDDITTDAPTGDDLVMTPRKIAALATLSNESVGDSSPAILDSVGMAMLRAVALQADRAGFHGAGGLAPVGILDNPDVVLPMLNAAVDYAGIVRGAGLVRAAGGMPNVVYLNPLDMTELQLATDGENRPLIQPNAAEGAASTIAGLAVYSTPALEEGEALVAQADQVVVAVRSDAAVAFSTDSVFGKDGTQARIVARLDYGVNDSAGLCVIAQGS